MECSRRNLTSCMVRRSMSDAKRNALYNSNVFSNASEAPESEDSARPLSRQQSQSKKSEIAGHNIFHGADEVSSWGPIAPGGLA